MKEYRILHIEDSATDADIIERTLQRSGLMHRYLLAKNRDEVADGLLAFKPDIVLCDHSLPGYNSRDAFRQCKQVDEDITFILVTGTVSEDFAVEMLNHGIDDYLLKSNLQRLPVAIEKAFGKRENERKIKIFQSNLEKSEAYLRSIINNTGIGFILADSSCLVLELNNRTDQFAEFLFGSRLNKMDDLSKNVFGSNAADFLNQLKVALSGEICSWQYSFKATDNSVCIYDVRMYPVSNADSGKNGICISVENITERKRREEELEILSQIPKETINSVIIADKDQKVVWVNDAFTRISGYSLAESAGKKPGSFLQGPETDPNTVEYMRLKLEKGEPFDCDVVNYAKSGRKYWLRIQCQPKIDHVGEVNGFFSLQTDVSREKEAEFTLKLSEERYRNLFDNSPASIYIWDLDTLKILEVNQTAMRQYGYSYDEFMALSVLDLRLPVEHPKIIRLSESLRSNPNQKSGGVWKHINSKGEELHLNIVSQVISFRNRNAVMAIAENITEKLKLQEALDIERKSKERQITEAVLSAQENERQEIGRELHDNITQILAGARLFLGILKNGDGNNTEIITDIDHLISSAINDVRSLSHALIPPFIAELKLTDALRDLADNFSKTSGIPVDREFEDEAEKKGDDKFKLTIYRIVQEQFNNINKYAKAQHILLQLQLREGNIELRVKDDGVGFDPATKTDGVGLINIRTRASIFDGVVKIISAPGRGCELRVAFPQAVH